MLIVNWEAVFTLFTYILSISAVKTNVCVRHSKFEDKLGQGKRGGTYIIIYSVPLACHIQLAIVLFDVHINNIHL
jgi:hypothetical protein